MSITLRRLRTLAFMVSIALFVASGEGGVSALGKATPLCDEVCTLDQDCGTECNIAYPDTPPFETDCGSYTDGQCGNTCDVICTPASPGETECDGITCEEYGVYIHCYDGYCARPVEDHSNCPADCISTTPIALPPPFDPDDPEDLCSASSYGGSSLPCPTAFPGGQSCAAKEQKILSLMNILQVIDEILDWFTSANVGGMFDTQIAALNAALSSFTGTLFDGHFVPSRRGEPPDRPLAPIGPGAEATVHIAM